MTYYISNHRITNEQIGVEAKSIASDHKILFQGDKKDIDESKIGGYELVNGVLTFNQVLYDNAQKAKLPIAQGKDLVSFIEKAFTGKPFADRMALQGLFAPIKLTLESQTCNPLDEDDFTAVSILVNGNVNLTQDQKDLFIGLARQWKDTVRFNR